MLIIDRMVGGPIVANKQINVATQLPDERDAGAEIVASNSPFPDVIAYKHIPALLITYFNGRASALIE